MLIIPRYHSSHSTFSACRRPRGDYFQGKPVQKIHQGTEEGNCIQKCSVWSVSAQALESCKEAKKCSIHRYLQRYCWLSHYYKGGLENVSWHMRRANSPCCCLENSCVQLNMAFKENLTNSAPFLLWLWSCWPLKSTCDVSQSHA